MTINSKSNEYFEIIKLGNCSIGNSEGGVVVNIKGLFPVITAGVHGYGMANICIVEEDNDE